MTGMLLKWQIKIHLANDVTFPTVYNLLGLLEIKTIFACVMKRLLRFKKNSSSDFMQKRLNNKKCILRCLHLNRGLPLEEVQ